MNFGLNWNGANKITMKLYLSFLFDDEQHEVLYHHEQPHLVTLSSFILCPCEICYIEISFSGYFFCVLCIEWIFYFPFFLQWRHSNLFVYITSWRKKMYAREALSWDNPMGHVLLLEYTTRMSDTVHHSFWLIIFFFRFIHLKICRQKEEERYKMSVMYEK